jgi:hypothetical protein
MNPFLEAIALRVVAVWLDVGVYYFLELDSWQIL